jgi:hypothetical protein
MAKMAYTWQYESLLTISRLFIKINPSNSCLCVFDVFWAFYPLYRISDLLNCIDERAHVTSDII